MGKPTQYEVLVAKIKEPGTTHLLWPFTKHDGYGVVWHEGKSQRVNRVVWELVNGPIPPEMIVTHRCDVRACFRPSHLTIGTIRDNNYDTLARGRKNQCTGERHPGHKLTEAMVQQIMEKRTQGCTLRDVVEQLELHVSLKLISDVYNGKRWRHITTQWLAACDNKPFAP